uniref:SGNH/GDSL hydrolase family protein n=1 Tax=Pseudonocardia pini TaxID=2758030 RepID=UPI0015F09407
MAWSDTWNTAMASAKAGTGRARVAVFGDSQAEGQGASARANRWQDLMLGTLRSRLALSGGGRGAVPAKYEVYGPDSTWGTTGFATSGSVDDYAAGPFGQRGRIVNASSTLTWTVQGTHAQIWYGAYSGMSAFGYKIDGGSTVTVAATSPSNPTWTSVALTLGSSGSHTVQIITAAGQSAFVGGLVVFDGDSTTGVTLLDSAKVGITADTYTNNAAEPHTTSWQRGIDSLAPDLVLIALGLNDWDAQTATAAYITDLQTIATRLRALTKVPSILVLAPRNVAPDANSRTITWSAYISALQSMVTTDGNMGFLNLDSLMSGTGSPGGANWTSDWHPTDAGHALIAGHVANALLDPGALVTNAPLPA